MPNTCRAEERATSKKGIDERGVDLLLYHSYITQIEQLDLVALANKRTQARQMVPAQRIGREEEDDVHGRREIPWEERDGW